MKKYSLLRSFITFLVFLLLISGGFWVINNYRGLLDFYAKMTSSPNSVANAHLEKLSLTKSATLILFGTYPEIKDKNDFNSECKPEQNVIELGCYKTGENKIFILNINEPNLENMETVTMAHELLHASYYRLSSKEKSNIDALVEKQLSLLKANEDLEKRLANYEKSQPGSKTAELYSIFGTEHLDLNAELEEFYRKYFIDRKKIVNLYNQDQKYLSEKEKDMVSQKSSIESLQSQLKALEDRMEKLKKTNNIDQYNSLVPQQNTLVEGLRKEIESYNIKVNSYNDIINSTNSRSYSSFDAV